MNKVAVISMGIGLLMSPYVGFKFQQAMGAEKLNNLMTDYGGGSFKTSIKIFFKKLWWGSLCFISMGLIIFGYTTWNDSQSKDEDNSTNQSQIPITTPSITPEIRAESATSEEKEVKKSTDIDNEKKYDGDDPIVRARLGLPPKEKSE
ncbi:hypothetical protein [Limnohabitans sp.]|uniref:hypothetical protein n=1 Tax=Limnohabitans sp. TaxID=1907725 RepID=UPI0038BC1F54